MTKMTTRHCNICSTTKHVSDFYKNDARCKMCRTDNNIIRARAEALAGGRNAIYRLPPDERIALRRRAKEILVFERPRLKVTEGYVYMITNPAWPGWYKIGTALDAESRCRQYNTGTPYRDYEVYAVSPLLPQARESEQAFHRWVEDNLYCSAGFLRDREWFHLCPEAAELVEMQLSILT